MELQTLLTLGGLGTCSVLLVVANWSHIKPMLPKLATKRRASDDPAALIDAYHVARDACGQNADLAKRTDQVFQQLICQKVLRCEK